MVLQNGAQAWRCLLCPHLHGDREDRSVMTGGYLTLLGGPGVQKGAFLWGTT